MQHNGLRETGQTLWSHVKRQLIDEIVDGKFRPGDRLPAEMDLVDRFGVSRHTVRRAMSELVNQGLVRIEQGKGAFVHSSVLHYRLSRKVTHSENIVREGKASDSHLLSIDEIGAPADVAAGLSVPTRTVVYAIRSRSYANRMPIALSVNYLEKEMFPDISLSKNAAVSMSEIYQRHGHKNYTRLKTTIAARPPTAEEAQLLEQPQTRWLLVTQKIDCDPQMRPICYGETSWVADCVQFVVEKDEL